MAKLSDSFTLNRGANNAPSKLSDTFTIKSNNTSSKTLSDTFTVAKPKVEQTSPTLYTSKKNNFEVTDDTLNKWLSADYKLTDEDKKQAREFIQKVDKTNLNRKDKANYNADLRNKINYLNSKAYGGAFASGLMEGINPFYDTVRKKIASDEDTAMYEGIKGQSKGAYTVGKLSGTAMDYALAGKIPGVQKLGNTIGQGLGGSKIANAIGGITADTLVDIGLDTIPEAVGNITDGKSLDEVATDASKNIKNNVLFNVGGELISNVPNVIKGIKQSRADRIAELAKEADLNAFDAGKATRKANTENAFNEILENSRNALKDADVANQNDAIAKRILEEQNATKETDLGELLAQARQLDEQQRLAAFSDPNALTLYRGFNNSENPLESNLFRTKTLSDFIPNLEEKEPDFLPLSYFTESPEVARSYARQDLDFYNAVGPESYATLTGRTDIPIEGPTKAYRATPQNVLDLTPLGERTTQEDVYEFLAKKHNLPITSFTEENIDDMLRFGEYLDGYSDFPTYALFRNGNRRTGDLGNRMYDFMKKYGYDGARFAEQGTNQYAFLPSVNVAEDTSYIYKTPIESGDINIDELLGVPVLNAPNRGDLVNTLNPYELVGATERQARKANNAIIPSLVEDTKNVDVPVKSVAENAGTNQIDNAGKMIADETVPLKTVSESAPVNATNESVALTSGELNQNRYSNITIPEKTDMPDALKDEFRENPQFYEVLKNKNTSDKATEILANNDLNEAYRQFGDLLSKRDPVAVPLGYDIAKQMVESGNTEGAVKVVEELSSALTSSGQFTQAAAIRMLKSDPMAAMRLMQKDIDKINANGLKKYKGKWVDFALTEDEINAFSKIAPGDTQAIQNLFEQITRRMSDSYPSTTWEKIVESTKTAMMLNPRTHIRNVAANTAMMPVRSLSDRVSALGQNIYHLINPDFKVTQSLTGGTSQQKKIANDIFDAQIKPLLEGGNKWEDVVDNVARNKQVFSDSKLGTAIKKGTKNTLDKLANSSLNTLTNGRIAKLAEQMDESMTGSVMENLRKFDYYLLGAVEDDPFVKSNFTNRLASYMKAQGINAIEDVPNEAIQTAYQEALKATFKDENYMTKMFKGIKNSTGKFGEVLLPFVKTPANLAKRGIEYSPIGFVDTLLHSSGKQTAEIIDDLAKNVTGTAGIVLGYELAKRGLIQGALSSDTDTQAFEKQQGKQAFSINVNGNYYTFDWAQPASIPLVIGTTIYDAIKESDEENANYLDLAKQSLTASVDAWADLSPISSLQDILGGSDYSSGSIGENIVNEITEFPQRLIPSLSGAIARTADTTYRQTYSKNNPWQTWLDTAKAKIPGLSQTLPASYDTWGNERKRQDSTGSAAFAQFINPGTLGYDASTLIDGEIQRLYESVGSNSVFPNKASWSVGDKTLTNEEYSNYQKSMGEKSYDMANAFINSSLYNSIDDSERANILSKLYSVAKSISENELFGKEIGNSNAKVSEIYKSEGAEGVIKYYQKKNDFDSLGVSLNSSEANAIYDSEGMQGLRNYAQTKQTIEDSGLKYSEKTVDTYNNYGVDGLNILSSIADTGSKNGNNILPVLESANLSDAEIGQWLATTANLTKTGQMFADSGAYEALATYYRIRKNADLDGNGSVKKDELIPYLESVGLDTNTWGKLNY